MPKLALKSSKSLESITYEGRVFQSLTVEEKEFNFEEACTYRSLATVL